MKKTTAVLLIGALIACCILAFASCTVAKGPRETSASGNGTSDASTATDPTASGDSTTGSDVTDGSSSASGDPTPPAPETTAGEPDSPGNTSVQVGEDPETGFGPTHPMP